MSKELEKFKKSWEKLKSEADKIEQRYAVHCTNRDHHKGILLESAKEIGRVVQGLKDNGKTGTKLADFANAKEMQDVMKTVLNANSKLVAEDTTLKGILKDCAATLKALNNLHGDIDKEVSDRKKKKDRKVLAVDSKSLPDMEKLGGTVKTRSTDLNDNVVGMQKTEEWSAAKIKADFEKWATQEIAKTKSDRNSRDQSETDNRGFDIRIVKGKVGEFKTKSGAVKTACEKAMAAQKDSNQDEANKQIDLARDAHEALKAIVAPYQRKIAKLNKYDKLAMEQSKDGKFILTSVEQMETALAVLDKLVKKTSRTIAV